MDGGKSVRDSVAHVLTDVGLNALAPMVKLLKAIPVDVEWREERRPWDEEIRKKVKEEVPMILDQVVQKHAMQSAVDQASAMVESLRRDWYADVRQIESMQLCRC